MIALYITFSELYYHQQNIIFLAQQLHNSWLQPSLSTYDFSTSFLLRARLTDLDCFPVKMSIEMFIYKP